MKWEIIVAVGIIVMVTLIYVSNPMMHFWKSREQQKDDWCKINRPMMNTSAFDEFTAWCYGEGWQEYCKISYPEYCPDNNYSDKDRCLKTCAVTGVSNCPCE